MSSLLGVIDNETPAYKSLKKTDIYEIRLYAPHIRAEVEKDMREGKDMTNADGFSDLAGFIFGKNRKRVGTGNGKIAMTAPVLTQESQKVAMTAPVLTQESTKVAMTSPVLTSSSEKDSVAGSTKMSFIMPSQFKTIADLPEPVNPNVKLIEVPEHTMAVVTFSGLTTNKIVSEKETMLREVLAKDEDVKIDKDAKILLGRYNPPWTLRFFRTNEIMIPVEWKGAVNRNE